MPRINVNLTEIESGFEIFPDGQYLVELTERSKVAKSDSGPYVRWVARIQDPEEYADKMISWTSSFLPQALWNLKDLLEKVGVDFDVDGFYLEDTFGKMLMVENQVREYNGQDRNNITAYYAV